jgi:hypothetical protein
MNDYYLSLTTTVSPKKVLINLLEALFEISSQIDASRLIMTAPVGTEGRNLRLHLVVRIRTALEAEILRSHIAELIARTCRKAVTSNQDVQELLIEGQILFSLPANAHHLDDTLLPDEWYIRSLVLEMGAYLGMVSDYHGGYLASGISAVIGQAKFGQLPVTLVKNPGVRETVTQEKGLPALL